MARFYIVFILALITMVPGFVYSKSIFTKNPHKQILIEAEEVTFNQEDTEVYASGRVVITQGKEMLLCDEVAYDKKVGKIVAKGDVSLLREDGSVYFSDTMEFEKNVFQGTAINFKARFSDQKATLVAQEALILNKQQAKINNLAFTTCKVCADNFIPNTPLWQVKAREAHIDQGKERIVYRDAKVQLFGKSIFYSPYFSMPTPNASRKSGFLAPKIRWTQDRHMQVYLPYYLNIKPNMDATITPVVSTSPHVFPLTLVEFRHLLPQGLYKIQGSTTEELRQPNSKEKVWHGHVHSFGHFANSNSYVNHYGFQLHRVYDRNKTYLRRHKLGDEDFLTSYAYLYNLGDDSFATVKVIDFQDLRAEELSEETPKVRPIIRTYNNFKLDDFNIDLNTSWMSLYRSKGLNYYRAIVKTRVSKELRLPYGQFLNASVTLRSDLYDVGYKKETVSAKETGLFTRMHSKFVLDWRWPLINREQKSLVLIEPRINVMNNSKVSQARYFPNEDSQSQRVSVSNLFDNSRYHGIDLLEGGTRINYGVSGRIDNRLLRDFEFTFGQIKYFRNYIEGNKKLEKSRSDIVGSFSFSLPETPLDLSYRFTMDPARLRVLNNEASARLKYDDWAVELEYYSIPKNEVPKDKLIHRRELNANLRYNIYDKWWLKLHVRTKVSTKRNKNNLAKRSLLIKDGIGLEYLGDCLNINFDFKRDHTKIRNLKPSKTYTLNVNIPK